MPFLNKNFDKINNLTVVSDFSKILAKQKYYSLTFVG